jgi:hypothetical protein
VTSPRDEIDDWLDRGVTPLSPPPGSLDRIRRRARLRKRRQALFAAAGCAVVIAAAVSVPQLISAASGQPRAGATPPVAGSQRPPSVQPSPGQPSPSAPSPQASGVQLDQHTHLSTTTSGTVPPRNFQPTSVTFVGTGAGTVVGAVIGQAGVPGHCSTADCTSLAGTSDYGASWYGVSAPVLPGPAGDTGVSQLRFTNLEDGWAFGPALSETSRGGWPWHREDTFGQRVIDVEAAGPSAVAIFATCSGTGQDYASDCTSFALYGSAAGSRTWTPVTVPAAYQHMSSGQASSAALVISGGTTGYLLSPTGTLLSGPVSGGSWTAASTAPCKPGSAQASGIPADAQLAAGPDQHLLLSCDSTSGIRLWTSAGGKSWQSAGTVPAKGSPASLASGASGQVVLATTAGIYYSADNGATWKTAKFSGGVPAGGFSYVGMTDATKGVAVPADAQLGEIYVTGNGGKTWRPSPISG